MNCEWCVSREAIGAGRTHSGLFSRMCAICRDRLCRRDALGQFIFIPIEEVLVRFPKGFYHLEAAKVQG